VCEKHNDTRVQSEYATACKKLGLQPVVTRAVTAGAQGRRPTAPSYGTACTWKEDRLGKTLQAKSLQRYGDGGCQGPTLATLSSFPVRAATKYFRGQTVALTGGGLMNSVGGCYDGKNVG
jgi:hypothetical protein